MSGEESLSNSSSSSGSSISRIYLHSVENVKSVQYWLESLGMQCKRSNTCFVKKRKEKKKKHLDKGHQKILMMVTTSTSETDDALTMMTLAELSFLVGWPLKCDKESSQLVTGCEYNTDDGLSIRQTTCLKCFREHFTTDSCHQ